MILGTFNGVRVGLNRGPAGEWVYAFEGGISGVGLDSREVEGLLSLLHAKGDGRDENEEVTYGVLVEAVKAGRPRIAEASA
jgi:hypothetical protein